MRLIDADVVIEKLREYVTEMESDIYYGSNLGIPEGCICEAIEEVPTIEAEPVRHGKWISQNNSSHKFCESCGVGFNIHFYEENDYRFCPYCDAKMDGGDDST